jgi:hypothetical protein
VIVIGLSVIDAIVKAVSRWQPALHEKSSLEMLETSNSIGPRGQSREHPLTRSSMQKEAPQSRIPTIIHNQKAAIETLEIRAGG